MDIFQAINQPDQVGEPEQRLATLRTQLLALGRTEGELNDLRDRVDSTSTTELSIIEVLELWQQIFRDTFS